MKKQQFTETQIATAVKQYEGGRQAQDVCREYGISRATLYDWRKKYSGMDSAHLRELKALQEENRRLKQMYAELSLDYQLLAERFPTRGFDDYYGKIRLEGLKWNRKRVLSVYRAMKLVFRRKLKRRLPQRVKQPLEAAHHVNYSYSMDFVSDALANGLRVRVLNVMDDFTRECLAAYADYSIPAWKVVMVLEQIVEERGKPAKIRVDKWS